MNKEAKEKIKALKEEIKKYEVEIKSYDKKIKQLEKEQDAVEDKKWKAEGKIQEIIANEWCKDADAGKFKIVCYYSDIPEIIKSEWAKIERGINNGCTGDWYDGCRGCEKHCSSRAQEAFMKMYNIGQITYGSEKDRKKKKK